jgi:hypothetical protein
MSESVRRTRGERVVPALGFALVVLLIAAPDYWTYHVLSSHSIIVGVSILIVSYVGFSFALWLLCIAARGLGLCRRRKSDSTQRSGSTPGDCADVPERAVDLVCQRRRHPRTRHRGCSDRGPRRRQASA